MNYPKIEQLRSSAYDNHPAILDSSTLKVLTDIQSQALKEGSLKGRCRDLSFKVREETGLAVADGVFLLDRPSGAEGLVQRHWWNVDLSGNKVGLSEQQFNPDLDSPFKEGVVILTPKDPAFKRYLPLDHPAVWRLARTYYWE